MKNKWIWLSFLCPNRLTLGLGALMIQILVVSHTGFADEKVRLGIEQLLTENLDRIQNKRVGIIGNHTSVDSMGNSIVSLVGKHAKVVALFGPEHGFEGNQSAGAEGEDSLVQGIPLYSLYAKYRTPTATMLQNVDVLIYDMQDVGVRFYTYISSLYLALSAAQRQGIPIMVLDRPNPVTASRVEGAILNPAYASYVGVMPVPIRYGMTVGELAKLMNEESYAGFSIGADLTIVPMKNYRRAQWFDETGIPWIAPSPNMPTLETAILYPGMCLLEGTNLSEGRGTDSPFLTIGAPFIEAEKWLKLVPEEVRAGLTIQPASFIPKNIPGKAESPKFMDQKCFGFHIAIANRDEVKPIDFAVALLCSAYSLYPKQLKFTNALDRLWGGEELRSMIEEGRSFEEILHTTKAGLERFEKIRSRYLLYRENQ